MVYFPSKSASIGLQNAGRHRPSVGGHVSLGAFSPKSFAWAPNLVWGISLDTTDYDAGRFFVAVTAGRGRSAPDFASTRRPRRSAPLRAAPRRALRVGGGAPLRLAAGVGPLPTLPGPHAPPGRARTLVLERRTGTTRPVSAVCCCAPPLLPGGESRPPDGKRTKATQSPKGNAQRHSLSLVE